MEESILDSIKKMLNISADYTVFDVDLVIHINSAFSKLHQIGATPPEGFQITGPTEIWSSFLSGVHNVEMVKTYIYLNVRLVFDPPATSYAIDAIQRNVDQYEWRLSVLELAFANGTGGNNGGGEAYIYDLTGGIDFPPEAPIGAIGVDFATGDVFRKE